MGLCCLVLSCLAFVLSYLLALSCVVLSSLVLTHKQMATRTLLITFSCSPQGWSFARRREKKKEKQRWCALNLKNTHQHHTHIVYPLERVQSIPKVQTVFAREQRETQIFPEHDMTWHGDGRTPKHTMFIIRNEEFYSAQEKAGVCYLMPGKFENSLGAVQIPSLIDKKKSMKKELGFVGLLVQKSFLITQRIYLFLNS